ncbi:CBS domain-containing protein [Candidatus Nitrosotalea bavarica]|uniref:CBS domain-containing protein n=1 Tax=Candidatus Nitrosotalea bavarica TaxID=1903277 RepID=UPI000C710333|nr:CBS domain-containing protein [Candidatus Nitrosotalea bavarica]
MTVARDIMSSKVVTIESNVSSTEIAKIMDKNKVSSIIITKDQVPIGIVTERDLVSKIVAQNKRPSEVKTSDITASPLVIVSSITPTDEVAKKMVDKKIRRVVVMDSDQALGIITVTDFVKHMHEMLADSENYNKVLYQHLIEDWEYWMS